MHPAATAQYPDLHRTYLDTASYGLPPASTIAALRGALDAWASGAADWVTDWDGAGDQCRDLIAPVIGCPPAEVSLQPAVSVGAAIALTSVAAGDEILAPADEFASILLPALAAAGQRGAVVRRTEFSALADSVSERTRLVITSHVRSNDGRTQDIAAVTEAAARVGARVLLDSTHAAGVLPVDADRLGIDFVVVAAYKHLLCPRGVAFLRVAAGSQDVVPVAASWRSASDPYRTYYGQELSDLASSAARFDVSLAWHPWLGAVQSLEFLTSVPAAERQDWCAGLASELAAELGLPPTGSSVLTVPVGDGAAARADLRAAGIKVSGHGERVRLSFHLYNDHDDVAAVVSQLRPHLAAL